MQVLYCADKLGIPEDTLNVDGGAISIGHPYGMSRRAPGRPRADRGQAPRRETCRRHHVRRRRDGRGGPVRSALVVRSARNRSMLISSGIRDFRADRAADQLAQELRHQPGISARRAVPPRPPQADQGTGLVLADSVRRSRRAGRHADDHLSARNAGNDHARRRRSARQRGPVVPRRFGGRRDHFGRKLGVGDGPGGGDRVARRDRPERARSHAEGSAGDQQAHAGPAVRGVDEVGRRDRFGGNQGRRHPRADAARDRQGSRSHS